MEPANYILKLCKYKAAGRKGHDKKYQYLPHFFQNFLTCTRDFAQMINANET